MKKKNKIDAEKELIDILNQYISEEINKEMVSSLEVQKKIEDRDKFIDSILKKKK